MRHDYYGRAERDSRPNATEIAKKYRRLALQYHPDKLVHLPKHEHKRAEATFKEIAEAKEVLSDRQDSRKRTPKPSTGCLGSLGRATARAASSIRNA